MAALEDKEMRPKVYGIEDVEREIEPCLRQTEKDLIKESFEPDYLDEYFQEHWFLETGFIYTAFWLFKTRFPGKILRFEIEYLPCGHVKKATAVVYNRKTGSVEEVSITRWLADRRLIPEELAD
jgi:hypothetical protein